jgi:hypothetical protein
MSTKSTIRLLYKEDELPGWQLYTEPFEKENNVYLELEGTHHGVAPLSIHPR